jgi:Pyridoxamine 5'-phosphate oxidase
MTASLPQEIQRVFSSFITTEYTTVDRRGQPISWPVTPYYRAGDPCIDLTTGLGYPKKAKDARANPKVALLFSDPTGSGLSSAPQVLVQGTAEVDDADLEANRERYGRELAEKLPETRKLAPPKALARLFDWYYTRIYVHVRPERIYVWADGDSTNEPRLFDAHMEEVRSGHDEEPPAEHAPTEGGQAVWDERMDELGELYPSAVLSLVAPDGFPFAVRLPISVDREARRIELGGGVTGLPIQPGLACLTAHEHHPDFLWQRNFQVRGDLIEDERGWAVIPHRLVGGFELPPGSAFERYRQNMGRIIRFRRKAKRELRERASR